MRFITVSSQLTAVAVLMMLLLTHLFGFQVRRFILEKPK